MKLLFWLAIIGAWVWIIWREVLPRLRTAEQLAELRAQLDAAGAGLWARLWARLEGWKTVILSAAGAALMSVSEAFNAIGPYLPDIVSQLQGAPWAEWFDAGIAKLIGAALFVASMLTRLRASIRTGEVPK